MVRITLDEDYGEAVRMIFGYKIAVPMQFGGADPALMTDFRGERVPLPAEANVWELDWVDDDRRSTLLPEEVAIHYFGDSRSAGQNVEAVRARRIPNFNDERIRVAQVWGDYYFSAKHGLYATVRIDLPRVPRVTIAPVNHNGQVPLNAPTFVPWDFFKWGELLAPTASEEMAELRERRRVFTPAPPPTIDLSNLSAADLDALVVALQAKMKGKAS